MSYDIVNNFFHKTESSKQGSEALTLGGVLLLLFFVGSISRDNTEKKQSNTAHHRLRSATASEEENKHLAMSTSICSATAS